MGTPRFTVDNTCENLGRVVAQFPPAGTKVAPASVVTAAIGTKPKHPCP